KNGREVNPRAWNRWVPRANFYCFRAVVCAAAHDGPLKRRRSRNPSHSASKTVTAAIDFPARILSGRLRITLRKTTQRMATELIAPLYLPKCQGPRSVSPALPLARHER